MPRPQRLRRTLIYSIISQALQEDLSPLIERKKYSLMHWQAAARLVRARGGPSSFVSNPKLGWLVIWWDYTCGSYQSNEWSFHYSSPRHSKRLFNSPDPYFEIRQQFKEFLLFLRNIEYLALVTKYTIDTRRSSYRYAIFGVGTTLRNLLSSPLGHRIAFPGQRRQLLARLASLLLINAALWDYHMLTELCEKYLILLRAKIVDVELDIYPTSEALAQILIEGIPLAEEGTKLREKEDDRPWFVGRMLKVAKRLGRPSWQKLNNALFSFLVLDGEFEPVAFGWEDELRREIMAAPLEALVLPAFSRVWYLELMTWRDCGNRIFLSPVTSMLPTRTRGRVARPLQQECKICCQIATALGYIIY
jgi:hypothetical protein